MRKHVMIPALLAMSVGLAACSHQPNANLESARSNFSSLQSDPQANKVAALETKDASDYLDKIRELISGRTDWRVTDEIYLATFAYSKLAMWGDLETIKGKVRLLKG